MKEINVNGQKRTDTGKKASKQLRYGEKKGENGQPEAFAFSASMAELRKAVYTPHVYVVNLNIDGKEHKAIIKELQFHPTTDALLHADFFEINETKAITVGIPVNLTGHAQGVRLDIDVTDLQLGKAIKVGSLSFEGLEIATSKEVIVCSVKATRASRSAAAEATAE